MTTTKIISTSIRIWLWFNITFDVSDIDDDQDKGIMDLREISTSPLRGKIQGFSYICKLMFSSKLFGMKMEGTKHIS